MRSGVDFSDLSLVRHAELFTFNNQINHRACLNQTFRRVNQRSPCYILPRTSILLLCSSKRQERAYGGSIHPSNQQANKPSCVVRVIDDRPCSQPAILGQSVGNKLIKAASGPCGRVESSRMAGGGAKPWSAVLPAALLVLAVILITAKADDYTAASTGSGSGLPSHCKLPRGCDKVLSLSACNNRVYNFLFCPSQRVDEAKNECCKALLWARSTSAPRASSSSPSTRYGPSTLKTAITMPANILKQPAAKVMRGVWSPQIDGGSGNAKSVV